MKQILTILLVLTVGVLGASCASNGYNNTQRGAAIGAGLGAITGQIIGRSTAGTLIGAAGGALAGAIVGNAADQDETNRRLGTLEQPSATYATPERRADQAPPGVWVTVPGQWVGGKWVPAHRVLQPVNP
jgi:hypothetical protein